MRLLLIDDSRLDRKMVKRLIGQVKMDASIAEADGVEAALGMVAIEHFDCILIDYHLNGADGVTLASQIKAGHGVGTPMVMLTGEPSSALAEQALRSGLVDFMSKRSLTSEQLRQALCNAMVKRKVARSLQANAEEDVGYPYEATSDMRQTVIQALSLLDQSAAFKQILSEDEGADIAIEMLRKAVIAQQHAH